MGKRGLWGRAAQGDGHGKRARRAWNCVWGSNLRKVERLCLEGIVLATVYEGLEGGDGGQGFL